MAPKSVGWWRAFASIAGALPEGLDRYRYLRQLDDKTKWDNEQHAMARQAFDQNNAEHNLQMENLQTALLGKKRDEFTNTFGVGDRLTPEDAATGGKLGYGGLISSKPTFDLQPTGQTILPATDLQGNAAGSASTPSYGGQAGSADYFSGTRNQRVAQDVLDRQNSLAQAQLQSAVLGRTIQQHQIDQFGSSDADLATKRVHESEYFKWVSAHPNATPKQLIQASASFSLDPNESAKALLDAQTRISAAGANGNGGAPPDPDRLARAANAVLTGMMAPSQAVQLYGGMGTAAAVFKQAMTDEIVKRDKTFNFAAADADYAYGKSVKVKAQLASLNNVKSGVDDLLKFSDAAARTGVPLANYAITHGGVKLGGKTYSNFKTAITAYADELSGALGYGSATDMSREMGFDMTDDTQSPDVFMSNVRDVVMPFVERKKKSMTDQMGALGKVEQNRDAPPPATAPTGDWKMIDNVLTFVPRAVKK